MQLKEAIENRLPLVVDHPIGGRRVIAELFLTPQGVIFFDVGWDEASTNPVHLLSKAFKGSGPWVATDDEKIRISELTEDDPLFIHHLGWLAYQQTEDGKSANRERAETLLPFWLT
jgi:hypothetical protein